MQDRSTVTERVPACPPGCVEPAGHRYDSVLSTDVDTAVRMHTLADDGALVSVHQEERRRGDGVVELFPAHIFVSDDGENGEYTAPEARMLAAALLNAADKLDEITGAQR